MKICAKCHRKQKEGKFCGTCGGPLEEVIEDVSGEDPVQEGKNEEENETEADKTAATNQPNVEEKATKAEFINEETAQKIKEHRQNYGALLLQMLKNPTKAFSLTEHKFAYAIVNFIALILTFSLTIIFLIRSTVGMFGEHVPYVEILFGMILFSAILYATVIAGTLLMKKMTLKSVNIKQFITQFGSLMTPIIILQTLTILFALGGSFILTPVIILIAMFFTLIFLPAIYMYEKAAKHPSGQKVYIAIGTVFLNSLFLYIVLRMIVNTIIGETLDQLWYF